MIHPNVIQKVLFSVLVLNPWNFGWLNFKHLYNHPKPTWRENCHFELISFLAWKKGVTTWCQADHSPWIVASNKLMLLMNTIMHHLECTSPIILCVYIYINEKKNFLPTKYQLFPSWLSINHKSSIQHPSLPLDALEVVPVRSKPKVKASWGELKNHKKSPLQPV